MAVQIRSRIPEEFTLGDKVRWTESHANYPASTWTLTYYFVKDDGTAEIFNVEATQYDGTDTYLMTISASDVAAITAGDFRFKARVTDGSDIVSLSEGPVKLLPDYSAAVDTRSTARQIVDAIDAALIGAASITQKRFKIRDREVERYTTEELIKERKYYQSIVEQEEAEDAIALGLRTKTTIRARFTGTS